MSSARKLLSMNIYRFMIRDWIISQVALIFGELAFLILVYLRIVPKEIPLPTVDLSPIASSDVIINLFSATISISGIILGFGSVVVIFYRRWLDDKIDSLDEKVEKTRNKEKKSEYSLYREAFMRIRDHYSRFAKNYVMVSLFALVFGVIFFMYTSACGFLALINMLVDIHVLLVVLGGIHPLMKIALWHRI